jgi:hypothetical protein
VSSDVIISGDTAYRAPPSVEVKLESAAPPEPQGDVDDIITRRIDNPIHMDEDGRELRQEIRQRKGADADPVVEWKAGDLPEAGEHEGHHTQIKRASEALYNARMAATAKQISRYY